MKEPADTWNEIIEKLSTLGIDGLAPVEKVIFRANRFLIEMDMEGSLGNFSPQRGPWTELRATADAVQEIGGDAAAVRIRELADLLEQADPADFKTWNDYLARVGGDKVRNLQRELTSFTDELWEKLETYTRAKSL